MIKQKEQTNHSQQDVLGSSSDQRNMRIETSKDGRDKYQILPSDPGTLAARKAIKMPLDKVGQDRVKSIFPVDIPIQTAEDFLQDKKVVVGLPVIVKFKRTAGGFMKVEAKKGTEVVKYKDVLKALKLKEQEG